jgi:hypothetical protein
MKTESLTSQTLDLRPLTSNEMLTVNGGGFFGDLFYVFGATAKSIYVFCKTASEFQHSLPANLKK